MRVIGLLVLSLISSPAFADDSSDVFPGRELDQEPNVYISSGAIIGKDHFSYGGVVIEAGRRFGRLRETPLFIRGMAHGGNTSVEGNPGRGTYVEARAGVEGRNCMRGGMLCASVGIDVGIHRGRYDRVEFDERGRPIAKPVTEAPSEQAAFDTFNSTVIAPRLTLDGGNRVRVRAVLERPYHLHAGGGVGGVAGSLMLGLGF